MPKTYFVNGLTVKYSPLIIGNSAPDKDAKRDVKPASTLFKYSSVDCDESNRDSALEQILSRRGGGGGANQSLLNSSSVAAPPVETVPATPDKDRIESDDDLLFPSDEEESGVFQKVERRRASFAVRKPLFSRNFPSGIRSRVVDRSGSLSKENVGSVSENPGTKQVRFFLFYVFSL
jgi:hypothetical protein